MKRRKMKIDEIQLIVFDIFSKLGVKTNLVSVRSTKETIAGAIGLKLHDKTTVLGIDVVTLLGFEYPVVGGIIQVNEKYLEKKKFTESEIRFILVHECVHIYNNHIIATLFWHLLEQILKGENNERYLLIEFIKLGLAFTSKNKLPPNAETLRNQEFEADKIAVISVTHDLDSAISCLTKLVDGNLDSLSHGWELFGKVVPAMTMRERIDVLRHNASGITS